MDLYMIYLHTDIASAIMKEVLTLSSNTSIIDISLPVPLRGFMSFQYKV